MVERNPLPDCLSHLAQLHRPERKEVLSDAIYACMLIYQTYPNSRFGIQKCIESLEMMKAAQ